MLVNTTDAPTALSVLERADFGALLNVLDRRGYAVVGPTVCNDVIVLDYIRRVDDLPIGQTNRAGPGVYRLARRDDAALFGYTVGPHSVKQYLLPPVLLLWTADRVDGGMTIHPAQQPISALAFLGVRPCDVAAIRLQDQVFVQGAYPDDDYTARRAAAFIIAVNCTEPDATCFCGSLGTGPAATTGFDLALTEVLDDERHIFVVESGSPAGDAVRAELPLRPAQPAELAARDRLLAHAAAHMGRTLDTDGLPALLYGNMADPHWDEIAARCLTCGNCTLVCPTCFCTTIEDATDLTGQHAERRRKTDTCFSVEFSHVYGGSLRASASSRYRQWLTHKLAGWVEQFGAFGCVGCGRCITWCPVGIDITEEARTLRQADRRAPVRQVAGEIA